MDRPPGAGFPVVSPSADRRPDPAAVTEMGRWYREIRAAERARAGAREALDAGWAVVQETLSARGQTYDDFVWAVTNRARV